MKRVLFALALLGMAVGGANADPTNLAGGAMITHYNPEYIWSEDPCADYFLLPLTNCDDQVNRIDVSEFVTVVWYVIANFAEDKTWCGCQFGFDNYDPAIMFFLDSSACYPPDGGLEIASSGWPGPLQGTAIVSTGAPWEGNWIPMYAFKAYAYGYGNSGVVQLCPDPTVAVPFGGFGNCASPPEKWDAALGGMGVNADGTWVCGHPVENYVCCIEEECRIVNSEDECIGLGGVFHPEWDSCDPNPCEYERWACCLFGECVLATQDECDAIGGLFMPGIGCDPNPCMPWGACCFYPGCECVLLYQDECEGQGGTFNGAPSCDPNPCPGSPTAPSSWGSIKTLYR
jgi:hypothetical protein